MTPAISTAITEGAAAVGLFGKRDDHHETPCEPGGFGWRQNKKNPMGWGKDAPRVVKDAGKSASKSGPHKMHGSTAEWELASGSGRLIKQSGERVGLDDKPGKGKRRP